MRGLARPCEAWPHTCPPDRPLTCAFFQGQLGHSLPHCFPTSASEHFVTWMDCHVSPSPGTWERQQAAHPVKVHGEPRDLRESGGQRSRNHSGKGRAGVELSRPISSHSRETLNEVIQLWPKSQKPICTPPQEVIFIFPFTVYRRFHKNSWKKGNTAFIHICLEVLPLEFSLIPVTHSSWAAKWPTGPRNKPKSLDFS